MRRTLLCLVLVSILGCQKSVPRAEEKLAGFTPAAESQAPAEEFTPSYAGFACDVLRSLRAVHDTKDAAKRAMEAGSSDPAQQAADFAERLGSAGDEVRRLMERWGSASDSRVQSYAREVSLVSGDLEAMSAALRNEADGEAGGAGQQAFVARKEDLDRRVYALAALVASTDPNQRFEFTVAEKKQILRLIEDDLFSREVGEFETSGEGGDQMTAAHPELFTVLAFRKVCRDGLQ